MSYLTVIGLVSVAMSVYSGTLPDSRVDIIGPDPFPTDGTKNLTLRATTRNLGDSPDFTWRGCPSDSDTCVFRPQLRQNGTTVFCTATDPATAQARTARYTLNLSYPPSEPPKIVNSTTGEVLSSGDTLTCTVSGGKPPVASVSFTCTNPSSSLPDQSDVMDATSVSSSLTVDVSMATGGPMVCVCSAEWSPDPSLYRDESVMNFTVKPPQVTARPTTPTANPASSADTTTSPKDESEPTTQSSMDPKSTDTDKKTHGVGTVVGAVFGGFVVVVVVVVVTFCMRRKKKELREDPESPKCKKESVNDKHEHSGCKFFSCCTADSPEPKPGDQSPKIVTDSDREAGTCYTQAEDLHPSSFENEDSSTRPGCSKPESPGSLADETDSDSVVVSCITQGEKPHTPSSEDHDLTRSPVSAINQRITPTNGNSVTKAAADKLDEMERSALATPGVSTPGVRPAEQLFQGRTGRDCPPDQFRRYRHTIH